MLSTVRVSIVVVMLAFSVCSNGVCSPVTSTVVDVVPTSSVRFTVEFCPSWTLILRVEVLKPSLLIVSVYSPGLSREYWYAPVADVVALNDSPVAELFNEKLSDRRVVQRNNVCDRGIPVFPAQAGRIHADYQQRRLQYFHTQNQRPAGTEFHSKPDTRSRHHIHNR